MDARKVNFTYATGERRFSDGGTMYDQAISAGRRGTKVEIHIRYSLCRELRDRDLHIRVYSYQERRTVI